MSSLEVSHSKVLGSRQIVKFGCLLAENSSMHSVLELVGKRRGENLI